MQLYLPVRMYTTLPSNIQFQPILKRSLSRPKRPLFYCLCGVQSKSTSKWSLCTLHHPLRGRHCLRLDDSLARGIGDGSSRGRPQCSIQPPWSRNFISITRNKPRAITHPRQPCSHRPTGCAIRLYTTATLADNDPILLLSFGLISFAAKCKPVVANSVVRSPSRRPQPPSRICCRPGDGSQKHNNHASCPCRR